MLYQTTSILYLEELSIGEEVTFSMENDVFCQRLLGLINQPIIPWGLIDQTQILMVIDEDDQVRSMSVRLCDNSR